VDLTGEAEYGRMCSVGGCESRGGVEKAGAGHDNIDAGLSGGERVAKGHVGCALLMARLDGAYLVAGIVNGVVEGVVVYAGQGEDGVDAVGEEALDKRFAAGTDGVHRLRNCSGQWLVVRGGNGWTGLFMGAVR